MEWVIKAYLINLVLPKDLDARKLELFIIFNEILEYKKTT
jgi:hypothetical protein